MQHHSSLRTIVMALALLLVAGCQNKGPTPKEGSPSTGPGPTDTTATGAAHPAAGAQDPHAGLAPSQAPQGATGPGGQPDSAGMIDVGAVAFKLPPGWDAQVPKSQMRRAQLSASGEAGPAELIVYFFGAQGAGSTEANIERWIGQFTAPDDSPTSDSKQGKGKNTRFEVTTVEAAGLYHTGMGASGKPAADQRLLAAIVATDEGPYYFKFLGPDATVTAHRAAFDDVIASVVAAP
jgi:hypothetical protein